ncbi:hypothetical protein D3C73_1406220 [compost metagenome]
MPQEKTALDQLGRQVGQCHGLEVLRKTLVIPYRGKVEHGEQLPAGIEYRAGRTGQTNMLAAKMFITTDGDVLSLDQAGADTVGALAIFTPYRAEPQPGTLKYGALGFVEHTVNRHTTSIGE